MNVNNLRPDDMSTDDWRFFERTPKTVLYAMAKHLAAITCEVGYDEAIENGAYFARMREEWTNLHHAGIVPQKPRA